MRSLQQHPKQRKQARLWLSILRMRFPFMGPPPGQKLRMRVAEGFFFFPRCSCRSSLVTLRALAGKSGLRSDAGKQKANRRRHGRHGKFHAPRGRGQLAVDLEPVISYEKRQDPARDKTSEAGFLFPFQKQLSPKESPALPRPCCAEDPSWLRPNRLARSP